MRRLGFNAIMNRNCRVLTEEDRRKPTYDEIINSIKWLIQDAVAGDVLYFHFIGHGSHLQHKDNKHNFDVTGIAPIDYNECGYITQQMLTEYLVYNIPSDVTCYCIFDCAHSGSLLELKHCINERTYSIATDHDYNIDDLKVMNTGITYCISNSLNVVKSNELPSNFDNYLEQSIGLLSFVIYSLLEANCGWNKFLTLCRTELLRCARARRALRTIPLTTISKDFNLSENPFDKAFPAVISHVPHKLKNKPSKHHLKSYPNYAEPILATLYTEINGFNHRLLSQSNVLQSLKVLRNILLDDERYSSITISLKKLFLKQSSLNINVLREKLYFQLIHLIKYTNDDLLVTEAAQNVCHELLKDRRFRKYMEKVKNRNPEWYKMMHEPLRQANENQAANHDDEYEIQKLMHPGFTKFGSYSKINQQLISRQQQQQSKQQYSSHSAGLNSTLNQSQEMIHKPQDDLNQLATQLQLDQLKLNQTGNPLLNRSINASSNASSASNATINQALTGILEQIQSLSLALAANNQQHGTAGGNNSSQELLQSTQVQVNKLLQQAASQQQQQHKNPNELYIHAQAQGQAIALARVQALQAKQKAEQQQKQQALAFAQAQRQLQLQQQQLEAQERKQRETALLLEEQRQKQQEYVQAQQRYQFEQQKKAYYFNLAQQKLYEQKRALDALVSSDDEEGEESDEQIMKSLPTYNYYGNANEYKAKHHHDKYKKKKSKKNIIIIIKKKKKKNQQQQQEVFSTNSLLLSRPELYSAKKKIKIIQINHKVILLVLKKIIIKIIELKVIFKMI